jgi:hypothetical protein
MKRQGPGVDFSNMFTRSLYVRRSQTVKILSSCHYLFALLGSSRVKAERKMLINSTPGYEKPTGMQKAEPK